MYAISPSLNNLQVNNAGRAIPDGSVRDSRSLLPAFDAVYALGIRGPYILVHELLDRIIKNKGANIEKSSTQRYPRLQDCCIVTSLYFSLFSIYFL